MNIKRRKSQRWFLENQKTKQLISLYVGDTKILRNRNVYNSTHCTIDIFKDRTIRIHEIAPNETYLNGKKVTRAALKAGDTIFLGNKNEIQKYLWEERTFLVLEKCEKKTEPLEQPPQNQMDNNEIQTILIEDDDDDGDDVGDSIINVTQNIPIDNESSVLHTPEYSPHTSPLQSSSCTIQTASSSTNQPSTSQGPNNASHRQANLGVANVRRMEKSKRWCLKRLNYEGPDKIIYLNEGETTIGRNKSADITSKSKYCSRNQCVITLNRSGVIIVKNLSSNGTYVNDERLQNDQSHILVNKNRIGLGCVTNDEVFDGPDHLDYNIFELLDRPADFIDLVSDDEEERDIEPMIVNGQGGEEQVVAEQPVAAMQPVIANQPIVAEQPAEPENRPVPDIPAHNVLSNGEVNDEDHDENEIYSQQVLMDIKQEVNFSDENQIENHDEDFSILIASSDSEDDDSNWSQRLSQNQDKVVKKITESVQSNKRKGAKEIEALPLIPVKRARANSVSAAANAKPLISTKTVTGTVNVGTGTSKKTNEDTKLDHYVDPLDPYAAKLKKDDKPKSFEDVLKQVPAFKPQQKRIAHVPKHHPHTGSIEVKSIMRHSNGTKSKKSVTFSDQRPEIREYTPDRDDIGGIIASPVKSMAQQDLDRLTSFENDPLHNIITDITEWKTDWITNKNVTPPITGVNFVVTPLTYKYETFDVYKDNVTSLLKHELWSSIQAENRYRNGFEVKINSMSLLKRAERKRYAFHVQVVVESANSKANVGDFVLVEADNCPKFFAYVTNQRFTLSGYSKTTYLTMEASESVVKLQNGEATTFYITPIANIRTELKLFNAVFYLDRTPFKSLILDPDSYQEPRIQNQISKFQYSGYDKLNNEQMEILKSVYNKCLSTDTSLSLIEGPPGTGKTRLIVSIILQLLFGQEMQRKLRILVLTSSNAAVDIIAKRLIHIKDKMIENEKQKFLNVVRYGVLNSMDPHVRRIAPQNLASNTSMSPSHQNDQHARNLLNEKYHLQAKIEQLRSKNINHTVQEHDLKETQKKLDVVNEALAKKGHNCIPQSGGIEEVMKNARIVCSTLSSAINLKQYIKKFDVCFIDEASQCTEPWTLVPLQYNVTSMILVGDSNQLSPVVLSPVCRENNLERSLFARLYDTISRNGPMAKSTYAMTMQYRMHPDICHFSNQYFYRNRLSSAPPSHDNFDLRPYSVFNLVSCFQSNNNNNCQYYNMDEAKFITSMLKVMVKHAAPKTFSYGIITPYAKQRQEIQNLLGSSSTLASFNIPVNTIDSYQGQERDIIILCTTRTTGIGFLANPQRLNVALTRAKKCLVICGNFTSISNASVWDKLIADAKKRQKYNEIPKDYTFQTIADVIIHKKPKPRITQ